MAKIEEVEKMHQRVYDDWFYSGDPMKVVAERHGTTESNVQCIIKKKFNERKNARKK